MATIPPLSGISDVALNNRRNILNRFDFEFILQDDFDIC